MPNEIGKWLPHELDHIAATLNARIPDEDAHCPVCRKGPSVVVADAGALMVGGLNGDVRMPTGWISCSSTICTHCGFIRQFANQYLGLGLDGRALTAVEPPLPFENGSNNGGA